MTDEKYVRSRTVDFPAEEVFALLSDPARHHATEPGDQVRDALEPEPLTRVGQVFAMNMYAEGAGGHYLIHNRVIAYTPGRTIAWMPGRLDEPGEWEAGGWSWRYDLEPVDRGCRVTLTYDWSAVPDAVRDQFGGMPVFGVAFIDDSLATLNAALRSDR